MIDADQPFVSLQQLIDPNAFGSQNNQALSQRLLKAMSVEPALSSVYDIAFGQLRLDSRQVMAQDVFVLLQSQQPNQQQSRNHLNQAAQNAAFILSEIDPAILFAQDPVLPNTSLPIDSTLSTPSLAVAQRSINNSACPVIYVPAIRDFLGDLIQARLQYSQAVTLPTVAAVTGTNGKTTISQLVAQLTQLTGLSSAVMGTAGNGKLGALVQATHTTGDALAVQRFLYQIGIEGADLLALEASSHGLDQQRLQGVPIKVAIYTNLSRDHLDYHSDMKDYARAKAKLFDKTHFPSLTHAIINTDDEFAPIMIQTAKASELNIWTYSLDASKKATFNAVDIKPSLQGVEISVESEFGKVQVVSPLLGRFNVANLLAALAAAMALGIDIERIATVIPQLQGAAGRMQRVPSDAGCFIVDYAHTPEALSQVLASLKTHCTGQLWAVFGSGGDRDTGKRPIMAQAGLAGADRVILTADNPRSEDPNVILQQMQVGMSAEQYQRTHIEPARKLAIEYAVKHASADDIVVIAGKGHETYQEIKGVRYDFDDRIVLGQALHSKHF